MNATLRLESPRETGGRIELAATLDVAGRSAERLWWRVPAAHRESLTTLADPFVVGFAFQMMKAGADVEVLGPVSRSLLANLESFMETWRMWLPDLYRCVQIRSREETEPPAAAEPDAFVIPFSAGVDSCFTALRHTRGQAGRNNRRIALGVTMFGFDVIESDANCEPMYRQLAEGAGRMLGSLGIEHVRISTNFRQLSTLWLHSHGTQLASAMTLFGRRFGGALIPNSLPVNQLGTLWGSHPYTDPLLGSTRFPIYDDGGAVARWEKIAALVDWPEAMAGLRVCFGARGNVGNCGECEKCIRTALAFRINDAAPAAGLPADVAAKQFRRIKLKHPLVIRFWKDLDDGIRARGKEHEPWAAGVRGVLRRAQRLQIAKAVKQPFVPLRNRIRAIFRGSTLSKTERAAQSPAQSSASKTS